MLRQSNYSIAVPLDPERTLLIHGYSGAWDIVTAQTAAQLRTYRRPGGFKPLIGRSFSEEADGVSGASPMAPEMRELLVKRGHLTTKSPEEEQALVAEMAGDFQAIASRAVPSYVFTLSYACNLACAYCFQDVLRSDPVHAPKLKSMSLETVDRIWAAMPEIDRRHGLEGTGPRNRNITLFGGEPLLERHRDLVRYIIDRARADGDPTVSAITNGTRIDRFADMIGPDGISFLQITLDGGPEEHDRRRIGPDRAPTFHAIADNLDLALELGARIKVRINVDGSNCDGLVPLAEFMESRGWFDHAHFSAYAVAVTESPGSGHDSCGFGSWQLRNRIEELGRAQPLVNWIDGPDVPWERRVREILRGEKDPLLSMQPSFCGAHSQTWVFDALGDIYACWERAGFVKERIGRVLEGGLLEMNARETAWRSRTVASNPVCGRCPYAFYCGGGCALLAEHKTGRLHSNYCDSFSQRFKALAAAEVRTRLSVDALAPVPAS